MRIIPPKTAGILVLLFIVTISGFDNDGPACNTDRVNHDIPERNNISYSQIDETDNSQQVSEEHILDEIERISIELDKMEPSEQMESPAKFAISGLLGTIAYGVAHTQVAWLFRPERYTRLVVNGSAWISSVFMGIINTAIPDFAIGALLGSSNYLPESLPNDPLKR